MNGSRINSFSSAKISLLLILVVAAVLRCWDLFSITLMNDELSALSRTHYDSFGELIRQGVQMDGHPPLVQVFLYFWTGIFGDAEWVIKLPFIFTGIYSVYLSWKIASRWFGESTALLTAAFLATLQFPVMYSQLARPYISGMFFVLLFVHQWIKIAEDKKYNYPVLIAYILSALACAVNHHFSALTAMIIAVTGFFICERKHLFRYILLNLAVILVYLPVLPLTMFQMGWNGLKWLGPPEPDFLWKFIQYAFQFSFPLLLLIAAAVLIFTIVNRSVLKSGNDKRLFFLTWFFVPFFTGYFYSVYVSPVLQYSFLLFSFPFLLMFIFSFVYLKSKWGNLMLVSAFLLLNIFLLVFEREHYGIFYRQPCAAMVINTKLLFEDEKIKSDCSVAMGINKGYMKYYEEKMNQPIPHRNFYHEFYCVSCFTNWLDSVNTSNIILGNVSETFVEIAAEKFPYQVFKEEGFGYNYYCLSKNQGNEYYKDNRVAQYACDFNQETGGWNYDESKVVTENSNRFYKMDSLTEWGPGTKILLDSVIQGRYYLIDLSAKVRTLQAGDNALLAMSSIKNDSVLDFRPAERKDYPASDLWVTIHVTLPLELVLHSADKPKGLILDVLFWNIEKKNVEVDDITITIRKGNKYFYSLFEEIKE